MAAATNSGTSLLAQTEEKKKKWGDDPHNYDIQGAIKNYDTNLAEYNHADTTEERRKEINAQYGGDITTWDNKTAYDDYNADLKYIDYVDTLNKGYGAAMDSAAKAESQKMQYADTRRQLMQKYLPETLMAQGVANTGYTADALLKAENNYNQYVMGAMNDRAEAEQNAMQSYQDALGQFKQEQNEEAYERFLAREETAKAEKEAYDAEQQGLFSTIDTMVDEGYITDKESAIAKMKAYGADDATVQKFSDYWDSTHSNGDTTGTTDKPADGTVEISGDAVGGEDATGNLATFKYSEENGYSGSLTATSENSDDPLRVDPFFKDFNFDRDDDKGKVDYDGTTYTIALSDLQPQSFLSTAKAILGDNYNKPQAMFMYNGEIYMVSDREYSNGDYKIYLMKDTGDLKDAITDSFK